MRKLYIPVAVTLLGFMISTPAGGARQIRRSTPAFRYIDSFDG